MRIDLKILRLEWNKLVFYNTAKLNKAFILEIMSFYVITDTYKSKREKPCIVIPAKREISQHVLYSFFLDGNLPLKDSYFSAVWLNRLGH